MTMTHRREETAYLPDEITARLAVDLPKWHLVNGCIERRFETADWQGTLMAVNVIGYLAQAAWHHPELLVSYAAVTVRLVTHDADGVTDKDFELACKIDEVVVWRSRVALPDSRP